MWLILVQQSEIFLTEASDRASRRRQYKVIGDSVVDNLIFEIRYVGRMRRW